MLPQEGGFAIMLQETGIATRAQEMHVAAALRDKGYTAYFSSRLAETGATSTSRGGGLLTAVSSKYVAEHEVLSFTEIVPGKAAALEIRTDGGGLTLINVHGPQAGCSPWAGRAAFWADIQMYATARSLGGRHPVVIAGDTNIYMDVPANPATEHFRAGWEACGFRRAAAGGEEDMTPTLHPSQHRVDTFLVNEPLLPWSLRESVWARGMAHPQVVGSDHLPVRLALPGLLSAAGRAAMPTPYSHTEGRLLPYDAEAAPVQHCLWAAVTAAQDEPSLAPWLGPAEQHDYGSMPAAAVDKVFEHLHATHDALARVVGRRQPSPAGTDPAEGDPPESGKQLQAAVLRYDTLAARAPAAYQADAARHGIRSEAALRLTEELQSVSPGFRPTTQGQLQEELERQAAALEEDIRQLRALLAADRKRAIKEFWRRHAPDIAQRWKAVRGAIEVEAPGPSGLWNVRVPNTQTLLTEAHDVMFAVRAFWRELYDKRPVDLPGFQAVLGRHVPRVPEGAWTQVQQYSMQDLKSALDKADGKAPGPNHVEARFIKALPAPVQWLLVHSYRAILRGAPPPMHWRDAHIWLSPKVPGSARLDDYRPIALGQLDMKLLTGPLTQRITEVLTRHGVVSDWQQGALPGSNTGPPLFMAQRQLQRGRPNYVFSFDARKAFDTAPHGALHLILRHLSVPPDVIDLLLFLHTCARLRIVTAHGLTQPVYMLRGVRQGNPESPLLYALLLEPLLRAQGHRLRPPGGAEHGLIQAYIDDLLVVAHTLQHFVEGVEAVAAYLGMMGMELNPRKCAMATTEGVPGLQLRLCPHLENPWYWVPAADSVPYLGLQLQPDGEFSLQRKHRLRLAAVHHWCLNTLAPPKVVQDVILAILGGVTQYVAPFIADDSDTARHLDHITVQVAKDRARYAFDASRDSLQDDRTLGLTRVPTRCQQAAVALVGTLVHHRATSVRAEVTKMFWEIAGAHGICPEVHYPVPEFATLAGGDWVQRIPRALAALGVGMYNPIACPRAAHVQLQSPPGKIVTLRTAKLRHRDTCRLTVPHATPWHGHHGPRHPFPDNDDPWPTAVRECLDQCADEHLHYCRHEQGPTNHPGWRDALAHLFHTTGTRDPRLRLVHPTRAKQDAHTGPRVTPDGLHLHVGGYRRRNGLSPPTRGAAYHPPAALMYILRDVLAESEHQEPNADVAWPEPLRPRPHAPMPLWLVTTDDQCTQAAGQAQLRAEWVIVQVGAGQPEPRGLPRGTALLVATGVPHDPHMAVHALEDQPEDTGHLVVHQRGGPAWLKEHVTALRSWASTVAGAEIRLHDHPAISPGDTGALSMDQLTHSHPDVRWHSTDLNAGWLSPTGYYWILEAWGHTSSDASGGGPCKHATSVALAADLTRTWAVAISGTVPDGEGVAASLPLHYGAHRPWVHTVDAEVILHLLRHADRERTTGVPAGAAKVVNQMPLRWLRDGLCARGQHAGHPFWYVRATSHHSDALLHKADWAASQDTVLQNTPPDPGHAQLIVAGRDGHLDLRPPTMRVLGEVAQRAQTDHALTHRGHTPLGAAHATAYVHARDLTAAATNRRALRARDGHTPVQRRLRVRKERLSGVAIVPQPCLFCGGPEETPVHMHVGCTHSRLLWPHYRQAVHEAARHLPPGDKALWVASWRSAGATWTEVFCSGLVPEDAEAQLRAITRYDPPGGTSVDDFLHHMLRLGDFAWELRNHRLEQLLHDPLSAAARAHRWLTAAEGDHPPPPPRPDKDFVASLRVVNGTLECPLQEGPHPYQDLPGGFSRHLQDALFPPWIIGRGSMTAWEARIVGEEWAREWGRWCAAARAPETPAQRYAAIPLRGWGPDTRPRPTMVRGAGLDHPWDAATGEWLQAAPGPQTGWTGDVSSLVRTPVPPRIVLHTANVLRATEIRTWGHATATVRWQPPEDGATQLTVAHFKAGGPVYDDALSRLGDTQGPLLLMLPTSIAAALHRELDGCEGLRVGWEAVADGTLLALLHRDTANGCQWDALTPHLTGRHVYMASPPQGHPRPAWDDLIAAFHDHGILPVDTWQEVQRKTLGKDYRRRVRARLLEIRDPLRQRWDDLWLRHLDPWSPPSHLPHTCRLCGECDTVSSAAATGANRCERCTQVAACPWPEPPAGPRRRTEEEALRRRIEGAHTPSHEQAGPAGAALLRIHVHLRDPTSIAHLSHVFAP